MTIGQSYEVNPSTTSNNVGLITNKKKIMASMFIITTLVLISLASFVSLAREDEKEVASTVNQIKDKPKEEQSLLSLFTKTPIPFENNNTKEDLTTSRQRHSFRAYKNKTFPELKLQRSQDKDGKKLLLRIRAKKGVDKNTLEDNFGSESSFHYNNWSSENDGWRAITSPNIYTPATHSLRSSLFSTRKPHVEDTKRHGIVVKSLQSRSPLRYFATDDFSWQKEEKQFGYPMSWSQPDHFQDLGGYQGSEEDIDNEDPCAAPRCFFHENKRSDFQGCVEDERYPYHEIYQALLRDPLIDQKLAAEPEFLTSASALIRDHDDVIRNGRGSSSDVWADYPGNVCPSRVEFARPRRLLNVDRQWRVIVNDDQDLQQTIRLETCLEPKMSCRLLAPCFASRCVQKFTFHRLLSYDPCQPEKGLFVDVYRLPIACSCAIHQF